MKYSTEIAFERMSNDKKNKTSSYCPTLTEDDHDSEESRSVNGNETSLKIERL
jgi:hypothetical protein